MLSFVVAEWLASLITKQEVFCSSLAPEVNLRGVLVFADLCTNSCAL